MYDGFPKKVTKEEKLEELMAKAAKKGTEVVSMLSNQVFDAEDSDGETVKIKKPKAESVPDVKGMDEQKTKVTETISKKEPTMARPDLSMSTPEANRHLSESLEEAITIYTHMKKLTDEDNHNMNPEEIDTLAEQVSETMQLVKEKRKPRYLFG